jgi:hypothetical protein
MRITDRELLTAVQPLQNKMIQFTATSTGQLTAGEVQLMKVYYSDLQERANGQMPRVFNSSCGSCIRDTFAIYASWYMRVKAELEVIVPVKRGKK